MAAELQLSDGSILELPDGIAPDAVKNYAQRAEALLASRAQTAGMEKGYGNEVVNAASAGLSGMNRSLSAFGVPVDALNWGMRKIGLPVSDKPVMGSDWITDKLTQANAIQPTRGHDTAAHFGELLGTGITTAATAGLAAPATTSGTVANTLTRALAPEVNAAQGPGRALANNLVGQAVGAGLSQAGEAVGDAVSGGNQYARMAGGMLGPLAPLAIMRGVVEPAARFAFARPNGESEQAFDTLKANGITPTPGLVGNSSAARLENAATYLPGGLVDQNVTQSFEQFQNRLNQLRGVVAGNKSVLPEVEGGTIGGQVRDAAREGLDTLKTRLSNEYEGLRNEFGPQRLVPVDEAVRKIESMGTTEVNGQPRARTDAGSLAGLDAEVNRVNSIRVPKAESAEGLLNTEIAARRQIMQDMTPGTNAYGRMEQEIAELERRLSANRQAPAEALDDTITKIGYDTAGMPTLSTGQSKQVYGALAAARERAYRRVDEGLGDRLKSLDEEYALRHSDTAPRAEGGDVPFLRNVSERPNDIDAYNDVSNPKRWDNASVVARNTPEQWGQIASDIIGEKSQLPASRRGEIVKMSPGKFMEFWGNLPNDGKIIYAQGSEETVKKLNSLYDAAQQFGQRSGTMNFSNSAPSGVAATFMGSVLSKPFQTMKVMGSSMLTGGAMTSPKTAEIIAGRTAPIEERVIRPAMQGAVRTLSDEYVPNPTPRKGPRK